MPDGTTLAGDTVPTHSPTEYTGLSFSAGDRLTFSVTGSVSHTGGTPTLAPDGGSFFDHSGGATFGISDVRAPIDSLIGVFLDDDQPDTSAAPATLNFDGDLDFASLSPLVKQVFFIGDGEGAGGTQEFVVPAGATRLFLGPMDGFGWYNNTGGFEVNAANLDDEPTSGAEVPLPAGGLLMLTGLGALAMRRRG